jgi:hypothetical protein
MSRVKYRKVEKEGPILVAARSEAWVCGRSPAEIVGLKPAGAVAVSCECCLLSGRSYLRRALPEESFCVCVCVCRKRPDKKKPNKRGGRVQAALIAEA